MAITSALRDWLSELWPWGAVAILLATVAMGAVVGHQVWLQDEIPIIQHYTMIHSVHGLWQPFTRPYWPPPFSPDLYRPLSLSFFCLQWLAGDGSIVLFHLLNLVLYLLAVSVVWRFALQLLPTPGAFAATALFAVHPVHVEAVAVSINQSEVLVALCLVSATGAYVGWRRSGETDPRRPWVILAIYLLACLVKESAIVLPGLLLAAELTIVGDPSPLRERLVRLRPWGLGMALIAVGFVGIRTLVLHGFVGSFLADGFYGLNWWGRANTMIGVVPRWAALLLWPAHLQEDYNPREIVGTSVWGSDQTIGVLILVVTVILLVRSWRRQPVAAFGILWFFIGIFPVSNIVVPTGIILAERTLLLPSVGAMLALGALAESMTSRLSAATRRGALVVRKSGAALLGGLLVIGVGRSATRMDVWRDGPAFWGQGMLDAPQSARVNANFALWMLRIGRPDRFVHYYREAIRLAGHSARLDAELANWFRHQDRCREALPLYAEAIRLAPAVEAPRSSMLACLLALGQYREAQRTASVARGYFPDSRTIARLQQLSESLATADPNGRGVKLSVDSTAGGLTVAAPNRLISNGIARTGAPKP